MKYLKKTLRIISTYIILITSIIQGNSQVEAPKNLDSLILAKSKSYVKTDISAQGKLSISSEINYNPKTKSNFFNYRIQGNFQTNIFGFTTPVNFSYSNGKTVYGYDLNPIQLPTFNRLGFSPKYKNITAHVGYRQMNMTKYTLNGLQFKGWGFEYQPEKYYLAFMKGVLKPAVIEDFTDISLIEPSFRRNAWAVKSGYDTETLTLGFAFLKSIDDPMSITDYQDYRNPITPRENAVIGLYGKKTFGEKIIIDFDYAFSGLSYDIVNDPFLDINTQYTAYNYFGLFTTRHNSIYDKALKSSFIYKIKEFDISYNYERVDPDFRSLGAFFFNNNFITRTAGVKKSFWEEKINVQLEGGVEKIAEPRPTQENTGRVIGSINTKYKVNDRLSLTGKYSNLNNSNLIRKPSLQSSTIDSILQTQTKEKIHLGSSIILGEEKNKILNIFAGYQRGLIVDRDQFITARNNISRNVGASLALSSEKSSHAFAYNISSISNNNSDLFSQSISYNLTKPINEGSNLSSITSINRITSESVNNIMVNGEIGYDFQYQNIHKIKTSLASQFGRSKTNNETSNLFFVIFKVNYDIGFNYQYKKRNE